jgi:hypothetical protein
MKASVANASVLRLPPTGIGAGIETKPLGEADDQWRCLRSSVRRTMSALSVLRRSRLGPRETGSRVRGAPSAHFNSAINGPRNDSY